VELLNTVTLALPGYAVPTSIGGSTGFGLQFTDEINNYSAGR
jgi:hypothetical protein